MRRLAVIALVLAAVAGSACAQRGGARAGGFGGRRSGAMRGGPAVRGLSTASPFSGNRSIGVTANRSGGYFGSSLRRGNPGSNRLRRPYGGYGGGIPFVIPIWSGWGDPGALGYNDGDGYDANGDVVNGYGVNGNSDAGVGPAYPDGYAPGQPDQVMPPPPYAIPYQPPLPRVAAVPQQPIPDEEAVTLVFRDGRPSLQIHNYALTRTTLLVMDGRRREIPLAQLDLDQTERVNSEAGVDFKILTH